MSVKALSWIVLGAIAVGLTLLFNYWVSGQLPSMLAYAGMTAALFGLANLAFPFRFMAVHRRWVGAAVLAAGVATAVAALYWPAPTLHVAQRATLLDEIMPEYQFYEMHSARIYAQPRQVLDAVRQSTFGDMRSLTMLLKVRGAVVREGPRAANAFARDRRILDAFSASGYACGGDDHEIVVAGGANLRAGRPITVSTLQEFADYREPGSIRMAFGFHVEETGGGWSRLTTETRVAAVDDSGRGMARYWRLIVPGSGLLRRQWLDGIRRRAERQN